jgi:peptide/nickel transport system permease protein
MTAGASASCPSGALAIGLVAAASALTFALVAVAPGNVAALLAERTAGANATAELVEKIADELGLNDPIHVRYGRWLKDAARGELGVSLRTGRPISQEFRDRVPVTARLLLGGGVIALVSSLALGIAGAISNGGLIDRLTRLFALVGASTPNFFVAALLVLLFSVALGWLPSFGLSGPASWILPWITVALFPACVLSRVVRVSLQEMMASPFATTGFAKGQRAQRFSFMRRSPILPCPFSPLSAPSCP